MSEGETRQPGPDLTEGIPITDVRTEGRVLGHVGDEAVLVTEVGSELFAVSATCTHYRGPLGKGLVVGDTVRCPWHHACFSLRTGEALRAPAYDSIACWRVERQGERVVIKEKRPPASRPASVRHGAAPPASVVIAGGGAAGFAAADMLRREGYEGPITIVSADADAPCDRPNLSKDYLAGTAQDDWMPLRDADYYSSHNIRLMLDMRVTSIDPANRTVTLDEGEQSLTYGALLLATGARPVRLAVPGADDARVRYLRSFADSRAIIEALSPDAQVVVVGASFIGLEVAASLRMRQIATTVVAPIPRPLEHVLGSDAGDFIRRLHESHGVVFHLDDAVEGIDETGVRLTSGTALKADMIVVGIGVRPVTDVIERAGLAVEDGVTVDEYLETSSPGVFAAGDIARWPDPHTGERIRVEHWVVAERQGQTAARNILGRRERFDAVPFFWSQHYDTAINYVGHGRRGDAIERDGDLDAGDCTLTFRRDGRTVAVATIGRDRENLEAEVELEQRSA